MSAAILFDCGAVCNGLRILMTLLTVRRIFVEMHFTVRHINHATAMFREEINT